MHKLALLSVATLLISCGTSEHPSRARSIGLPGLSSASNSLLWLQGDSFQFGACERDRLPSVDTCVSQYQYSTQNFERDLMAPAKTSLEKLKTDFNAEIKKLKDQHPVIAPALMALNTLKTQLEAEKVKLSSVTAALQDLNQKIHIDQKLLGDYEQDIADIRARLLEDPNNARLLNLLTVLQGEKETLATKLASNRTLLDSKSLEKSDLTIKIADLEKQKTDAETNYIIKYNSISVESDASSALGKQIQSADADLNAYTAIRDLAKDGISYRQTLLSASEKKALSAVLVQTTGFDVRSGGGLYYRDAAQWLPVDSSSMNANLGEVICRTLGKTYRSFSNLSLGTQSMARLTFSCQGKESTAKSCANPGSTTVSAYYQATLQCDAL